MSFRNEKTLKDAAGVGNKTGLVSLNIKQRAEVATVYPMLLNSGLLFYSVNVAPSEHAAFGQYQWLKLRQCGVDHHFGH